jgi:hypothetical protein
MAVFLAVLIAMPLPRLGAEEHPPTDRFQVPGVQGNSVSADGEVANRGPIGRYLDELAQGGLEAGPLTVANDSVHTGVFRSRTGIPPALCREGQFLEAVSVQAGGTAPTYPNASLRLGLLLLGVVALGIVVFCLANDDESVINC